jgi:hypothetical protein
MVLLYPPAVRNCEPPAGLSRLAGALRAAGEPITLIDGAWEGMMYLVNKNLPPGAEKSSQRVYRSRQRIMDTLTSPRGYSSLDRYKKNISDLNTLINSSLEEERITPADHRHRTRSPLRSADLAWAYENPHKNPYYPWFSSRLNDIFNKQEEKTLALSLCFLSQTLTTMAILGYLKSAYPEVRTVLGGSLVSSWSKGATGAHHLKDYADSVISGPGERELTTLTGRIYQGPGTPWFGSLTQNTYLSPGLVLPYSSADSCSWKRCTFCAERWEDYPYHQLPVETALKQINSLVEELKPLMIHMTDSELSPALLEGLADNPIGTDWYGFSRFLPAMLERDYCRRIADSGCVMLCLGLESGDQNVLNRLNKGINLNHVSQILKNLKEAGIGTFIYLLFGTPAEDRTAAQNTVDFIHRHRNYVDFLNLAVFTMPRISKERETLETSSFYEGDLGLSVDFKHPHGWNRKKVRNFLDREFHRNGDLQNILKRMPPIFTSSHAPFFLLRE